MYKDNIFDLILCYTTLKEYTVDFKIASERIYELDNPKIYPKEEFGNLELKNIKGKIEIKNLSFAYDKKKVLENINLIINPNESIGIVGKSGSGKTTLFNLLSKGYDLNEGEILLDNINLNKLTQNSIRDNISMVSQNPYIFNLSIKENLMLLTNNIKMKDIKEACIKANIHDYIESLPNKYDTLIGEGGVNLSGGQKQRLAIARALLKNSKIILFDEATSALDNETQSNIQKSIDEIGNKHTIIIVAHRLSTIKNCDKIIVLDKGKIVGIGKHNELMKKNNTYKKLYKNE